MSIFHRLSTRARKVLESEAIVTLAQLSERDEDSFRELGRGKCGKKTIQEFRRILAEHGLYLKGEGVVDGPLALVDRLEQQIDEYEKEFIRFQNVLKATISGLRWRCEELRRILKPSLPTERRAEA